MGLASVTMRKRMLASASHSADSHRADGLASSSSADAHRAADGSPDTMVALMSYNVGIQNKEIARKQWRKEDGKYQKLRKDVQETFEHDTGNQQNLVTIVSSSVPCPAQTHLHCQRRFTSC